MVTITLMAIESFAHHTKVGHILMGTHELSEMSTSNGSTYFIISGGSDKANIIFSWKMNNGYYSINSLSASKIRVNYDPNQEIPTIKFRWNTFNQDKDTSVIMKNNVLYAVVTCKKSDWVIMPKKIKEQDVNSIKRVEKKPEDTKPTRRLKADLNYQKPLPQLKEPESIEDNPKWKYIEKSFSSSKDKK